MKAITTSPARPSTLKKTALALPLISLLTACGADPSSFDLSSAEQSAEQGLSQSCPAIQPHISDAWCLATGGTT